MKILSVGFKTAFATFGGAIGYYLGGLDEFLYTLIAFVLIDYATGVVRAIHERKLSSKIGFTGIFRKITIFALVGLANVLDLKILGTPGVLRTATIFFYLSNEGISILENTTALGLPIPQNLRHALAAISTHTQARFEAEPKKKQPEPEPEPEPKHDWPRHAAPLPAPVFASDIPQPSEPITEHANLTNQNDQEKEPSNGTDNRPQL